MGAIANLVWETSTTTGTGNLTTARNGGYQRGSEAFGTSDLGAANPYIFIVNRGAVAAEWELCQAHWSDANTLVRGTTILSSNANAAVNFGAGTKDISNDVPATLQAMLNAANTWTARQNFTGGFDTELTGSWPAWSFKNVDNSADGFNLYLYKDSASPAAADALGAFVFVGRDSAANQQEYGYIRGFILDPTSGSVDGEFRLSAYIAGSLVENLFIGNGVKLTSVLSYMGAGTLNADQLYNGGVPVYSNIPQNSKSAAYTLVLADAQKHIFHPSADTTARTWTIPANSSVAFPIGTAITFINQNAGGVITIAITTDTMRLAGAGTTGSRSLAANGVATAVKVTSTEWIISGTGLT